MSRMKIIHTSLLYQCAYFSVYFFVSTPQVRMCDETKTQNILLIQFIYMAV